MKLSSRQMYVFIPLTLFWSTQSFGGEPDEKAIKYRVNNYLMGAELNGFSGAILIARGDQIIFNSGYGFADKEKGVVNSPGTVFSVGSVTKQFTATAILKLVEQKRLALTDPIGRYFEAVPKDKERITIHQLLTHTSGLLHGIGQSDFDHFPTDQYFSELFSTSLLFNPGARHSYSNAGYSVLARIIELVSKRDYERFMLESIFKPAGMYETGYLLPAWQSKRLAKGYAYGVLDVGSLVERYRSDEKVAWPLKGNGGIHSTHEDMFKWYLALRNNTILSKEMTQKLITPYVKEYDDGDSYYAYGWAIFTTDRNTKLVAHNGSNGVFFHDFMWLVEEDMLVIYSTNALTSEVEGVDQEVAKMLFDEAYLPSTIKTDCLSEMVSVALDYKGSASELEAHLEKNFVHVINSEYQLNDVGYIFLDRHYIDKAIALFSLNVKVFPNSGNLWGSLGEAYYKNSDFKLAKLSFEKALSLKLESNCYWCENSKAFLEKMKQVE